MFRKSKPEQGLDPRLSRGAESRQHRKGDSGTLSELADVEFPACLKSDN